MEEWKTIEGFSNYIISNTGKIKSLNYNKTGKTKELSTNKLSNGYLSILLYDDNKIKHKFLIHRLVALAFIKNPNNFNIINHKDENRSNNNIDNLEWCNHKYNANYGNRNKKLSESLINNLSRSIPVLQYSLNMELVREFPSIREAARIINNGNINAAMVNITKCCRKVCYNQFGKVCRKTAYGYIWEFKK